MDSPPEMAGLLAMIPTPNEAVRPEAHGQTLILYVPIRPRWWTSPPISWMPGVQFRKEKGIALDQLGREVWEAVDGKRTTEAIIEAFARRHQLRFHEARMSVMQFLQMLMQRGLIVLVGAEQATTDYADNTDSDRIRGTIV